MALLLVLVFDTISSRSTSRSNRAAAGMRGDQVLVTLAGEKAADGEQHGRAP
jgi:hypothetical protein